jgi:hypothetical protein
MSRRVERAYSAVLVTMCLRVLSGGVPGGFPSRTLNVGVS